MDSNPGSQPGQSSAAIQLSLGQMPGFSGDLSRIEGWTMPGTEAVSRVMIPVEAPDGRYVAWSELLGRPVVGGDRWSRLALESPGLDEGGPPYGFVDSRTASRMVSVLAQVTSPADPVVVAISRIYCDDVPDIGPGAQPPGGEYTFLSWEQADLFLCPDLWVLTKMTRENNCHFPVALWTLGLTWSLAAPLYSDSWFFSGPRVIHEALIDSGLESLPVSRSDRSPAEGD